MTQTIPSTRHRDLEHVIALLNDVTRMLDDAAAEDIKIGVRSQIVRATSRVHTSLYLLREMRSGQESKLSDDPAIAQEAQAKIERPDA